MNAFCISTICINFALEMEADSRKTPSGYLVDTFEGLKAEVTDFEELLSAVEARRP